MLRATFCLAIAITLQAGERPKIVGIANIAVKVDDLNEARRFYTGYDWVEYMVRPDAVTPRQLGVFHHYALGTMDIQQVYKTVLERGYKPPQEPRIARDGRWLTQLYDKNFTRTEMMVRKPVQTPCCSPNLDDYKPAK